MDKKEVAAVLEEIALLLELAGENPFKVRAYEAGARAVLTFPGDLDSGPALGGTGPGQGHRQIPGRGDRRTAHPGRGGSLPGTQGQDPAGAPGTAAGAGIRAQEGPGAV